MDAEIRLAAAIDRLTKKMETVKSAIVQLERTVKSAIVQMDTAARMIGEPPEEVLDGLGRRVYGAFDPDDGWDIDEGGNH